MAVIVELHREGSLGAARALPDAEVVRRIVAGERALFELLMRRYNARVYWSVRAIMRSEAEIEDVMQTAYLSAFAHLAQFRGKAAFSSWLTRIALNEAFGRSRRRLVEADLPDVPEELADDMPFMSQRPPDPERSVGAHELTALIERALDRLPQNYRTIFTLRQVKGLSTAETAEFLGVSEEAVKVRLHRARAALRNEISAETDRCGTRGSRLPLL